jgi:DNA-packaging protein gp3
MQSALDGITANLQALENLEVTKKAKHPTKPKTYTNVYVLREVRGMLDELADDTTIIYKGQLFEKRPYSSQRFSEWANEFKGEESISDAIAKIEEILQTRAVVGGLKNKLNASILKFHLINNFGWVEKTEVVNTNRNFDVVEYIREVEKRNFQLRQS